MKNLLASIVTKLNTTKLGVTAVASLSAVTALAVIPSTPWGQDFIEGIFSTTIDEISDPVFTSTDDHGVKIVVKQSQSKIVQNGSDEIYLDVRLDIPSIAAITTDQQPTDLVGVTQKATLGG